MSDLGRLEPVRNIRSIWQDEARHFTPWLADNLPLLATALGFPEDGLELEGVEMDVGPFRADILCRDTSSGSDGRVLIENQFGATDHDHLGKLTTYASGLGAKTIVHIAETFRPEHRRALLSLNEISDDEHSFFGVSIELWKIGDSPPAPRFSVVAAPDGWSRAIRRATQGAATERGRAYQKYWTAFADVLSSKSGPLSVRTAPAGHYCTYGLGRSGAALATVCVERDEYISVQLVLQGPHCQYWRDSLFTERSDIEAEVGAPLDWQNADGRKRTKIVLRKDQPSPLDTGWLAQHQWLADRLVAFDRAFRQRISRLEDPLPTSTSGPSDQNPGA